MRGGVGEDALADRGAEVAALVGVAGLEDDRLALRRPGDVERPDDLEVLAPVVQRVLLGRVEEDPRRPVARERVVLVGVPQRPGDPDVLQGAAVAGVVVVVLVEAEVAAAPASPLVTTFQPARPRLIRSRRREPPRDVERLVVGGGQRADQADVRGRDGQRATAASAARAG